MRSSISLCERPALRFPIPADWLLVGNGGDIRINLPGERERSMKIDSSSPRRPYVAHKIGSVELDMNCSLMGESNKADFSSVSDRLDRFFGLKNRRFGLVKLENADNAIVQGYKASKAMPSGWRRLGHQLAMAGVASEYDSCAFHDVAPLMLVTTQSLSALNQELQEAGSHPVDMDRMRANIVVKGGPSVEAWDEEFWAQATFSCSRGSPISLRFLQGCVRCTVPTTR